VRLAHALSAYIGKKKHSWMPFPWIDSFYLVCPCTVHQSGELNQRSPLSSGSVCLYQEPARKVGSCLLSVFMMLCRDFLGCSIRERTTWGGACVTWDRGCCDPINSGSCAYRSDARCAFTSCGCFRVAMRIVRDEQGHVVVSADNAHLGENVELLFGKGSAQARITQVHTK
jgi:hypothetical protein